MRRAPVGATQWSSRDFRSPGRGSDSILTTNPPRRANLQCPFGTSRSLSSTNSRYAMRSSRFEVDDFAKHLPITTHHGGQALGTRGNPKDEARNSLLSCSFLPLG